MITRRTTLAVGKGMLAIGMLWFLASDDRLTIAPVREVLAHPMMCALILLTHVVIFALGVARWWLLLAAFQERRSSLLELMAISWIGQFFGLLLPSAVATDATRLAYLKSSPTAPSDGVLPSLVIDRLAGVLGTLLLAVLLSYQAVIALLAHARATREQLIVALLAVLIGAIVVFAATTARRRVLVAYRSLQSRSTSVSKGRWAVLAAISLAMAAMALKVLIIWMALSAVSPAHLSIRDVYAVAPVGFLIEALPVSPAGIGTGHAAFEYLLALRYIAGGAAIYNIYLVSRLLVAAVGGIVWLSRGRATT